METKENSVHEHVIKIDDYITVHIRIPRDMNILDFKGLSMKKSRLCSLASIDIVQANQGTSDIGQEDIDKQSAEIVIVPGKRKTSPRQRKKPFKYTGTAYSKCIAKGKIPVSKNYTPQVDKLLVQLRRKGYTLPQIASHIERVAGFKPSISSLYLRLAIFNKIGGANGNKEKDKKK